MGFLIGFWGWVLKNPVPVLGTIFVAFFLWTMAENKSLKAKNEDIKGQLEHVQEEQQKTQENISRVDGIQSEMQRTRSSQSTVRERIREVPVKGEDRPFINDPGLLDRIDVMRNHQQSYRSNFEAIG